MLLSIDRLSDVQFCVNDIYALQYSPFVRNHRHEKGRDLNGFFYSVRGGCTFSFDGRQVRMEAGGMSYLPRGSHHAFSIDEGDALCLHIDFTLRCAENGEEILFF